MDIPIIVIAHNRPDSLRRLLRSLETAVYEIPVQLYISIDGGGDPEVFATANRFNWNHGKKEVIRHGKNLGLKKHVLACADKSLEHDGIIILEDDLFVSPLFYCYAQQAVHFSKDDEKISGVSLYAHGFNETAQMPFQPLSDGSDIFFMQLASSWGQCFTKEQWSRFKRWYQGHNAKAFSEKEGVPVSIIKWPEASWKKHFIRYMILNDLYFIYPRASYSTNFGDDGTHHWGDNHYQASLIFNNKNISLTPFDESRAVYDSYCEILPDRLNRLTGQFHNYDYAVDLYGQKNLKHITSDYILTSKGSTMPIFEYGRKMIPHEANIISEIGGDKFQFTKLSDAKKEIQGYTNARVVYYHGLPRWHLKEKKAEQDKPATLTEREETLLRIHAKKVGKLLFTPVILLYKLYITVRNIFNGKYLAL